jgi:hypothetical protein
MVNPKGISVVVATRPHAPAAHGAVKKEFPKIAREGERNAGAARPVVPRDARDSSDARGSRDPDARPPSPPAKRTAGRDDHLRDDPLDPIHRQQALLAPPIAQQVDAPTTATAPIEASRARASLEELLPAIVKRIAWSGDARRGAVRIELGAGALAGATLLIESEDGRVRVRLDAPPGTDAKAWRERIAERLAAKRIAVEAIHVD